MKCILLFNLTEIEANVNSLKRTNQNSRQDDSNKKNMERHRWSFVGTKDNQEWVSVESKERRAHSFRRVRGEMTDSIF